MLPGPPQKLPNLAQEGDLGAIMAHLGRNLLPTWPILRPSWAHLRPNFAKNLRHIAPEISRSAPRDPKTTQGVARGLQDSPWSLNFHGFGVDFGPHFGSVSAVSPSILHGLTTSSSGRWRLGARSALDKISYLFTTDMDSFE